jgi:hypothetical protein
MKNLEHLAPAALSQVAAVGVPHEREVSYTAYRENIDAFVAATMKKERVFCSAEAFGRFKEDKTLPFPKPRIAFSPQKDFSETQEKKMMQNMGAEAEKKKAGKVTHYVFQAGLEKLPFLHLLDKISSDSVATPKGCISVKGALTYFTLSCIIAEFLRVNTYPAFSKFPDDSGEFTLPLTKSGADGTMYKGYSDANRKKREIDIEEMSYSQKKRKMFDEASGEDVNMEWSGPARSEDVNDIQGRISTQLHDAVFTAKPSPCPHGTNIGSPKEVPNLPGLVFPILPRDVDTRCGNSQAEIIRTLVP